jgi:hypothetical protein
VINVCFQSKQNLKNIAGCVDDALTAEGGGLKEEPDALLSVRAAVRAGAAAGRGASFGVRAAAVDVEAAAVVAGELSRAGREQLQLGQAHRSGHRGTAPRRHIHV